jgi:hypothetical protein
VEKDELATVLSSDGNVPDLGPIEEHLRAIATERDLPGGAIAMCTARVEEAGPALRAVLARAADGEVLSDDEKMLVFRGLYVLGATRDAQSWPILLRLLRRPADEVEELLGDAVTENLAQIAAGMFTGDADALFGLIAERSVGEYARSALLGAAAFLTWEGRIEQRRMREFLERFYAERLADDGDFAWVGWFEAIALLGLRDLAPLFYRAWDEGRIDSDVLDRQDFEKDLIRTERAPTDIERFEYLNLGYINNALEALAWTNSPSELTEELEPSLLDDAWSSNEPFVNPWRDVGRNDPCPCGSGKKAKKCCLG